MPTSEDDPSNPEPEKPEPFLPWNIYPLDDLPEATQEFARFEYEEHLFGMGTFRLRFYGGGKKRRRPPVILATELPGKVYHDNILFRIKRAMLLAWEAVGKPRPCVFVHHAYGAVFHSGEAFGVLTFAVDGNGDPTRVRSLQNGFRIGEQFTGSTYKALSRADLLALLP